MLMFIFTRGVCSCIRDEEKTLRVLSGRLSSGMLAPRPSRPVTQRNSRPSGQEAFLSPFSWWKKGLAQKYLLTIKVSVGAIPDEGS